MGKVYYTKKKLLPVSMALSSSFIYSTRAYAHVSTRDSSRDSRTPYVRTYVLNLDTRVCGAGRRSRPVLNIRILLQIRPSNFGKC